MCLIFHGALGAGKLQSNDIELDTPRIIGESIQVRARSANSEFGVLQWSTNLLDWLPIATNALSVDGTLFEWPVSAPEGHHLFRIQQATRPASEIVIEEVSVTMDTTGGSLFLADGTSVEIPSESVTMPGLVTVSRVIRRDDPELATETGRQPVIYQLRIPSSIRGGSIRVGFPEDPQESLDPDFSPALLILDPATRAWSPIQRSAEDGDHETLTNPVSIDLDGRRVAFLLQLASPDDANSEPTDGVAKSAGYSSVELRLVKVVRGSRRIVDVVDEGVVVTKSLEWSATETVVDPVTNSESLHTLKFSIPFHRDDSLGLENHYSFDVTQDQASSFDLIWFGKQSMRPRNSTGTRRRDSIGNGVFHVILHDYGNPLKTVEALRNICFKVQSNFAHFYVGADGVVFQLGPLNGILPHAYGNNESSVGIEMEPLAITADTPERFSAATVDATARLTASLLDRFHLPFDPEVEILARLLHSDPRERFFNSGSKKVGSVDGASFTYVKLPEATRDLSVVGHNEIQGNKQDPKDLNWYRMIDLIGKARYPAGQGEIAGVPLIDTSAAGRPLSMNRNGGNVLLQSAIAWDGGGLVPAVSKVVPPGGVENLTNGQSFSKVRIGAGARVIWSINSATATLRCRSLLIERGAVLRIASTLPGSVATIECERFVQIDGQIDASGDDALIPANFPVGVTLRSAANRFLRVPAVLTRGGNSSSPMDPGGAGGGVFVSAGDDRVNVLWGLGGHIPFPTTAVFPLRTRQDYFGFGGNSFSTLPASSRWLGVVTSGGSGPGGLNGPDSPGGSEGDMRGGDGGVIVFNGGTNVVLRPFRLSSGASDPSDGVLERVSIKYVTGEVISVPGGGNGGRGRISFGNVIGGNGGRGSNAGDIQVMSPLIEMRILPTASQPGGVIQASPVSLLPSASTRFDLLAPRRVFAATNYHLGGFDSTSLVVSAAAGSGGPKGGDKQTGNGLDGPVGTNGLVELPVGPAGSSVVVQPRSGPAD